jgi:oligoendopeptidase F
MTTIFPSLESDEFSQAFDRVVADIAGLAALFDERNVRRNENASLSDEWMADYEIVTGQLNRLLNQIRTLGSYIGCFTSTDARDELAQSKESLLNAHSVKLNQLQTRYVAWVGTADVDELLKRSEVARSHEYPLRRAQKQARHQMSEAEESLMAELQPSGLTGWARLHGNLTALMTATVNIEGEEKLLPMSSLRSLANDGNREVRKAAYEAEVKAWETVEVPLAAALNGIKGFQRTVRSRRDYADDVEPTLLSNGIDRSILEAMQQACAESFPDFRRYMKAKAQALGIDRLGWYDINASLGES